MRPGTARFTSRRDLAALLFSVTPGLLFACGIAGGQTPPSPGAAQSRHVYLGGDGRLVYAPQPNGDTIPDFSNAGYGGGGVALPSVAVKRTVSVTVPHSP